MSARPFVPPMLATVDQAIADLAAKLGCSSNQARDELRKMLSAGQVKAYLVHYQTGQLSNIPAQRWYLEKCLSWLQTGKAEITAAEGQVWRSPERRAPICDLYIDQSDQSEKSEPSSSPLADPPDGPVSRRAVSEAVVALWGGFDKIPAIPVIQRDRQIIDWLKADRNYNISEKTIGRAFKGKGQS